MKILLIGLDGIRSDFLLYAKTPNINRILQSKNTYYNFNTYIKTKSLSGPSWGTILSGKNESITKIKNNEYLLKNFKPKYEDIFSYLNSKNIKNSAIISDWINIYFLVQQCNNVKFITFNNYKKSDKIAISESIKYVKESKSISDFLFLYIVGIDEIGHEYGYGVKYIQYIQYIDKLLGKLFEICQKNNWNIIITTDHGGSNKEDLTKNQLKNFKSRKNTIPQLEYIGVHGLNIPEHKQSFQIYYGKFLKKINNKLDNHSIFNYLVEMYK